MEIARSTDLPDLLTALGYQVIRIGRYYSTKEMDSLRIKNRRTWYRYSEKVGGDAITFLQHFCGKSFPEAVEYLLAFHGRTRDSPTAQPEHRLSTVSEEAPKPFELPAAHADQRRVFAYLRKRSIASQVIQAFIAGGLLYEDAQHHNCVFVGYDETGKAVFANQRGTYDQGGSSFKGDVPGSDKSIGFRLPYDSDSDTVFVFEAPIDLMSYCTLHRSLHGNAVALCCLHDGALATYLREHPQLRHIELCLDNDRWGQAATKQMQETYSAKGFTVSRQLPPQGKDWNEYLQKRTQERGR